MARLQSLDELIAKKAAEFAEQVRNAAAVATKEEEIRIEVERQLAFLEQQTGVKLHGQHEFTVAKGRIDSFYTRVLIEYYALFMKLLASEIVAFFHSVPTPLKGMMSAVTSAKLKREMEELEAGSIFRHLNITNFLEGDLFAWYTAVWTEPIERLVRRMVAKLDDYNPGTMSEDPATSRDLLKKLYQQLFPKSVRRDLGEYYTPDWLAEHVLNELGYVGDPDKRLLDPACGSGTFLVMAINRIKRWFDKNREKCSFDEGDFMQEDSGERGGV